MGGKTHKDIVIISLDQMKNESMDISSLIAFTNGTHSIGNLNSVRYFLRIETVLEKVRDQK